MEETKCVWYDVPDDLADRIASILTRIMSNHFDAKITVAAISKKEDAA